MSEVDQAGRPSGVSPPIARTKRGWAVKSTLPSASRAAEPGAAIKDRSSA